MLRFVLLTVISGYLEMNEGVKVKESEVAQSCPTLCDPIDCSLPRSSVHGIFQARVLEWVLQRIFLTQGLNPGLLHCKQSHLSHDGSQ